MSHAIPVVTDRMPLQLRDPSAYPKLAPAEVIALVLTTTQWTPGRILDPDGSVVQSVLKCLEDAGWKIVPL